MPALRLAGCALETRRRRPPRRRRVALAALFLIAWFVAGALALTLAAS